MPAKDSATAEAAALKYLCDAQEVASAARDLPDVGDWRPNRVAVVGAGTMGSGIATAVANVGIPTLLLDRSTAEADRGRQRVQATYAASVRRGRLTEEVAEERLGLINTDDDLAHIGDCDLVIEAVIEDLDVKRNLFASLDQHAAPHAVLGTNTSALDIDLIAAATSRPEQVIGTHFFSPANVMRLLELVPGAKTAPLVLAHAFALGRLLGKVPVRAGNSYGFIGNAMMLDYLREADFLLEEGALPADVDRALQQFGLAMGPYAMRDMAGLDIGIDDRRRAIETRPADRRYTDLDLLPLELGRLGQKTGAGWYRYPDGSRTPEEDPQMNERIVEYSAHIGIRRRRIDDNEIVRRCLYALVNRAGFLLQDGVAARAGDIDVVYTTGYGFPARLGGPLYWADSIGLPTVLAEIRELHRLHAPWWEPSEYLQRLVTEGRTFTGQAP